jgi:hypothetical protein
MRDALSAEFVTIDDVVTGLKSIEEYCLPLRDRRGIFVTAYLHITRSIQIAINEGRFENDEWTQRYLVSFGNLYRRAVLDWETGNPTRIPTAWRLAFETASEGTGLVVQHLVLGINAHINHDLALALGQVGIDPNRGQKYRDHVLVNKVLEEASPGLKYQVSTMYAPILQRFDWVAGRLDDDFAGFSIPKAREHAWTFATAFSAAWDAAQRKLLLRALDQQAAGFARLILSRPTKHPTLLKTVRLAENLDAIYRRITVPLQKRWY